MRTHPYRCQTVSSAFGRWIQDPVKLFSLSPSGWVCTAQHRHFCCQLGPQLLNASQLLCCCVMSTPRLFCTATECQSCRGPHLLCLSFLELHQDAPWTSLNRCATHLSPQGFLLMPYLHLQNLFCPALLALPLQAIMAGPYLASHSHSDTSAHSPSMPC